MAIKTSPTKSSVYANFKKEASVLRKYLQDSVDLMLSENVSGNLLVEIHNRIIIDRNNFQSYKSTIDFLAWAIDQEGDPLYNVILEINNISILMDTAEQWIKNNFPSSAGFILKDQLTPSGVTVRTFSPSDTSLLRSHLSNIISSISI